MSSEYILTISHGEKRCSRCNKLFPKSDIYFARDKRKPDGFRYSCKVCRGSSYGEPRQNKLKASRIAKANAKPKTRDKILAINKIYRMKSRSNEEGVEFNYTLVDWEQAQLYFNHSCAVCGQSQFPKNGDTVLSPDHWIPISKGGASKIENIIPLCHGIGGCNNSKGNNDPIEWIKSRYHDIGSQEILARIESYFEYVLPDQPADE